MTSLFKNDSNDFYKLFFYTFLLSLVAFGFALTNNILSVDNEIPIISNFALETGRWGQNLIRFHIFNGHQHYYTVLFGLVFFSFSAVRLSKLFRFNGIAAYFFCGLFVTFPQIAYELVFRMMADIAGLGIFLSVVSLEFFLKGLRATSIGRKVSYLAAGVVITAFTLSTYQAFITVIPLLSVILFFQNTYEPDFKLKKEFTKLLYLALLLVLSVVTYYISVKIICPPIEDSSYLTSFLAGEANNHLYNIFIIWRENLTGQFYYGERLFVIAFVCAILLSISFVLDKWLGAIRFLALLLILFLPFVLSFGITNGYHPPRLYVTTNVVFAFLIVFALIHFKVYSHTITKAALMVVVLINVYYITSLFNTADKIFQHDRRIAEKIDNIIQAKYPEFYTTEKNIYFYGYFPYEYHQNFRLEKSEVFGGSIYNWGNAADNYRLVNFFKDTQVAEYKMLNTKEQLDLVKDSIPAMPTWPHPESIQMIGGIVVVKLGQEKGANLYFE